MFKFMKKLAKNSPAYPLLRVVYGRYVEFMDDVDFKIRGVASLKEKMETLQDKNRVKEIIKKWEDAGKPVPAPSCIKQKIVREYGTRYGSRVLIETGTYRGEMIYATKDIFETIHSIELGNKFYERAKCLFSGDARIKIHHGDSTSVLPQILRNVEVPCLFWLDAHYSGGDTAKGDVDTPICAELETISKHKVKNHVILIDDAREFVGKNDYPSIAGLKEMCKRYFPKHTISIEHDVIRICMVRQESSTKGA